MRCSHCQASPTPGSCLLCHSVPWFAGRCIIACKTPRMNASLNLAPYVPRSPYLRRPWSYTWWELMLERAERVPFVLVFQTELWFQFGDAWIEVYSPWGDCIISPLDHFFLCFPFVLGISSKYNTWKFYEKWWKWYNYPDSFKENSHSSLPPSTRTVGQKLDPAGLGHILKINTFLSLGGGGRKLLRVFSAEWKKWKTACESHLLD